MNVIDQFKPNGSFLSRDGPARSVGDQYCNRKLCFVATDRQFLLEVLHELSLRDDCFFVKLSSEPRDGMYLGRCFFTSETVVGEHWAKFKAHPRLMCTIQDDDFAKSYRSQVKSYANDAPLPE